MTSILPLRAVLRFCHLAILSILLFLSVSPSPFASASDGPSGSDTSSSDSGSTSLVPVDNASRLDYSYSEAESSRFAYVMMHYEGTPKDDEYMLGLRVLIETIKRTQTPYDIVIILSENVRPSSRAQLLADGAKLVTVPNLQNPFKETTSQTRRRTYKSRFEFTFNKLYSWALIRYERVIFLDSDNLLLGNIDELFLCGHFCVVYMNPLLFHTGLMVIKPDLTKFNSLVQSLFSPDSYSHDGADQGFLCAVFDVEHSPLFDLRLIADKSQPLDIPAMRLPIGYNLNHFYWYINFGWDFFRRNDYYYRQFNLPGLTLAYPAPAFLKPWFWYPVFYFHHHWTWQSARDALGLSYFPQFAARLAAFAAAVFIARAGFRFWTVTNSGSSSVSAPSAPRRWFQALVRSYPITIGYFIGFICWLFTSISAFRYIPSVLPSLYGYSLFYITHTTTMYGLFCLFAALLRPSQTSNALYAYAPDSVYEYLTGIRAFTFFLFYHAMTFWVFQPFFVNFIIKIGFVEVTALLWIGYEASLFKEAAVKLSAINGSGSPNTATLKPAA